MASRACRFRPSEKCSFLILAHSDLGNVVRAATLPSGWSEVTIITFTQKLVQNFFQETWTTNRNTREVGSQNFTQENNKDIINFIILKFNLRIIIQSNLHVRPPSINYHYHYQNHYHYHYHHHHHYHYQVGYSQALRRIIRNSSS